MRPIGNAFVIPPRAVTRLEPGGTHMMLIGLERPLMKGQQFKGTLVFANAGRVELGVQVEAMGSTAPDQGHGKGH
jgi:copper(I)-binding protein